jgi:hypothetical protein
MTPRGSYRSGLETHPGETRDHAARVGDRLGALGHGANPLMVVAVSARPFASAITRAACSGAAVYLVGDG